MSSWEVPTLLAWLRSTGPRVETMGPFELLEISPIDDGDRIQDAYYAIAASRHPDLFRGRLSTDDAELLMRVFSRITAAYATLRDPTERRRLTTRRSGPRPAQTPPGGSPVTEPGATAAPGDGAATAPRPRRIGMKAMSYVRRAEAALDAGDRTSAVLNLRMAVAAEPSSRELRQLLSDTEAQLRRK